MSAAMQARQAGRARQAQQARRTRQAQQMRQLRQESLLMQSYRRVDTEVREMNARQRYMGGYHEVPTMDRFWNDLQALEGQENEMMGLHMVARSPFPPLLLQMPPREEGPLSKLLHKKKCTCVKPRHWRGGPPRPEDEDENERESPRATLEQIVQFSAEIVVDQVNAEIAPLGQLQGEQRPQEEAAQQDDRKRKRGADDCKVTIPEDGEDCEDIDMEDKEDIDMENNEDIARENIQDSYHHNGDQSENAAREKKPKLVVHGPRAALQFIKSRGAGSNISAASLPEQCTACLVDTPQEQVVETPCGHPYCGDCFKKLIATVLDSNSEAQWPPKCCLVAIPSNTIVQHLSGGGSEALLERYKATEEEYNTPQDQRIYCSHPDCGEWIRPTSKRIDMAAKTARCSKEHIMCVMCLGPPHEGQQECPKDRDLQLLGKVAEESGWKRCYNCHALVEHATACARMTCRCGASFCYICGQKDATCNCDANQLVRIKARAEQKRREREGLPPLDPEAEALNDPFRWHLPLAFRLGLTEGMWMTDEALERLRTDLLGLQVWQRAALHKMQTREANEVRAAAMHDFKEAKGKADRELSELRAESSGKLLKQEAKWKEEEAAWAAREKRLDEEYATRLRGSEGDPEKASAALQEYKKQSDVRRDAWRKTRREEQRHFWRAADEQLLEAENKINAPAQEAETTTRDQILEVRRRHEAELRWLGLVTEERSRLLDEIFTMVMMNPMADDGETRIDSPPYVPSNQNYAAVPSCVSRYGEDDEDDDEDAEVRLLRMTLSLPIASTDIA